MTQKRIKEIEKQLADAKRTIADLRNRVKSFKNVTDHLYDGIMISSSAGKLIFVNSKACELTGYTKQELVNVGLNGLFAPGALEIIAAGSSDKQTLVDEPHQTFPTALRCINGRTLSVMLS